MEYVDDFKWKKGIKVEEYVENLGKIGFQSIELKRASDIIIKMKKAGAKIFLSFTSNMVTSGRSFPPSLHTVYSTRVYSEKERDFIYLTPFRENLLGEPLVPSGRTFRVNPPSCKDFIAFF